jgi:hypothetical protein
VDWQRALYRTNGPQLKHRLHERVADEHDEPDNRPAEQREHEYSGEGHGDEAARSGEVMRPQLYDTPAMPEKKPQPKQGALVRVRSLRLSGSRQVHIYRRKPKPKGAK